MNFRGFIYLNINHPLVAWETYRGALISADQTKNADVKHPSLMTAGIISANSNIRYMNELQIEQIRADEFPEKISRLRGFFAFGDLESAQIATSWNDHFVFENLVEADIHCDGEPTRVDSNWITFAKINDNPISAEFIPSIRKYWNGEPYNNNPCWEYLINGSAIILGTSVRKKAYETIKKCMPASLALLELCRISHELGSNFGHCIPWIRPLGSDEVELCYIIDFSDADNELFLKKFASYDGPKNTEDLNSASELVTPDLTKYFCKFKLSKETFQGFSLMEKINEI